MAQFTNQAQLTYNNRVTNSNVAIGEILEVLSATKTAVKNSYTADGSVTYIVSILNSGTESFTDLSLTDNLGAYSFNSSSLTPLTYVDGSVKYYINGVLQSAPTVTANTQLVISGINVPASGNTTVVYETTANQYAPLNPDSTINNTVSIGSGSVNSITASSTVTVDTAPILSISKSVSPVPVTENGTLTYTFLIQNFGNTAADAGDNIVITDTFNPALSNLAVKFNDAAWTAGTNYTYTQGTGQFATVAGQVTVPAATYTQDPTSGAWSVVPGVSTLVVSGTV